MRSFTRRICLFLLTAAFAAAAAAQAQDAKLPKIAGYAYGAKDPAVSRATATRLVTAFVNSGHYKASEAYREFFEYAADGYTYTPKPVSVAQFRLMGQQFGIDYICVAEVATIFGEERIFAHLIDVKTAKIIAMAAGDTPLRRPADLTAASNQIVTTMLKNIAATTQQLSMPKVPPVLTPAPCQPVEAVDTTQTTDSTANRKTPPARIAKNGLSLGYGYDPELYILQLGFVQTRTIIPKTLSFAWEANVWGGAWSGDKHKGDYSYGANIPLLCQLDISAFSIEAGAQIGGLFYNSVKDTKFTVGAIAGAGISPHDMLRIYSRFSYNYGKLKYYSLTFGVRTLF